MSTSSNLPPPLPPADAGTATQPLPQLPLRGLLPVIEALLRRPSDLWAQLGQPASGAVVGPMLLLATGCLALYGVVVGTFSGGTQLWAAPLKVVLGFVVSSVICLPSLYIFACLGGAKVRLMEVVGLLSSLAGLMALLLVGFAPIAWIFGQSTESLVWMGILHLAFWLVATAFAFRLFFNGFRVLGEGGGAGLKAWMLLFMLVVLQMTTALRPILGTSESLLPAEKRFFLNHWARCFDQPQASKVPGQPQ